MFMLNEHQRASVIRNTAGQKLTQQKWLVTQLSISIFASYRTHFVSA